jgi:hypothetical protein
MMLVWSNNYRLETVQRSEERWVKILPVRVPTEVKPHIDGLLK